jgi:hypothetical protein
MQQASYFPSFTQWVRVLGSQVLLEAQFSEILGPQPADLGQELSLDSYESTYIFFKPMGEFWQIFQTASIPV